MSVMVRCRRCGKEFEADRTAILTGTWRLCPDCAQPQPPLNAAPVTLPRP